jgi:DivIVA domain-containing protein
MPLTPEDVHKKTFTPVRLREGYDMGEVDQFLDEVEAELTRLHRDCDDLRARLDTTTVGPETGSSADPAGEATTTEAARTSELAALPVVRTAPEASTAAARLLEIATKNAEQLISEAQSQADEIVGSARTTAEHLEGEANSKAEQLSAEAKARAQGWETELTAKREQALGELERDKESLARALDDLRAFEQEYRARLRTFFQSQLRLLDGGHDGPAAVTPAADGDTPRRLRELLGEDQA